MNRSVGSITTSRFPQLLLPIQEGMNTAPAYRDAVLRGKAVNNPVTFPFSKEDTLTTEDTPAGPAEILYFAERDSFVRAYRALGYRCEPVEIPDSVGAATIRGLINWEKIHRHKAEYFANGGADWSGEFKRFTADKSNYLDTLILLSRGEYSNVTAQVVGLPQEEWLEKSLTIRKYHELTHFVCRGLYPTQIDALRDEVLADLIGLVAAFGEYDPVLAKTFLGIEGRCFREGGRLSHYVKENMSDALQRSKRLIDSFATEIQRRDKENIFSLLLDVFELSLSQKGMVL